MARLPDRSGSVMDEFAANLTIDVSAGRYGVVAVAALLAGMTDALWFRISNGLTIPLIVSGLLYHGASPAGEGALFTILGAGFGFGILVLLFVAGGVGAGDVKLLTGIGAWIGPHDVLVLFIVAGLLVGLYSLVLITWTNAWREMPRRVAAMFRRMAGRQDRSESVEQIARQEERKRRARLVPMGAMIAFALLILLTRHFLTSPRADLESHATRQSPVSAAPG
jgi:prepilin peptidase CpaA